MISLPQSVSVHLPLEPTLAQRRELDELAWHVQAMQTALNTQMRAPRALSLFDVLTGVATPSATAREVRQVSLPTRSAQVRQLMAARRALGWTERVSSDVIEGVVQASRDSGGGRAEAPSAPSSQVTIAADNLVVPVGRVTVIDLETIEVPGLNAGHVLIHLHLPLPLERAVAESVNRERRYWRSRAAELRAGAALGRTKDAAALAHLYARSSPHVRQDLPVEPTGEGIQATFRGVDALVRRLALDGELRWFARLTFDVRDVPQPAGRELIGVDVGIHLPVCGYAPQGAMLTESEQAVWVWPDVIRTPGRVTTPCDPAQSKVRWYQDLHRSLQLSLSEQLLGPAGVLMYRHVALERLEYRRLRGPAGFGAYMQFSGLAAYLEVVAQLRSVVYVDPEYTSVLDARTGLPGSRRGLLFHPPSGPARLADLNAARNIYQRGQARLQECTRRERA